MSLRIQAQLLRLGRCAALALLLPLGIAALAQTESTYLVIHSYPHDTRAFTQGLIFVDGNLYESTGREGHSSLRKEDLETGKLLQFGHVSDKYFAEGLTNWGSTLIQLTWQSHIGFVYDRQTFRFLRSFQYDGEGWGLTQDGKNLIMSDGTASLRFLDPATFQVVRRIVVSDHGKPVKELNELEFVKGEIYANIWHTDRIARISPSTGAVLGWIELNGLLPAVQRTDPEAVLNGIAYDAANDRLFVTGKLWPRIFEIKVIPRPPMMIPIRHKPAAR